MDNQSRLNRDDINECEFVVGDGGNSFEKNIATRGSEATRALYEKAQSKALH
jgi:hypothetical protein